MPITYNGTLPSWITIDVANSRLVGAANTFYQGSQALANNAAQTALNDFATEAIGAGTLNCGTVASCTGADTNRYALDGYVDGDIDNSSGDAPVGGEVVWDGTYPYKQADNSCAWMATYDGGPALLMDGNKLCNSRIFFEGGEWKHEFYSANTFLWQGDKQTGTTPAGTTARTGGVDPAPATLDIVSIGGATVDQPFDVSNCVVV